MRLRAQVGWAHLAVIGLLITLDCTWFTPSSTAQVRVSPAPAPPGLLADLESKKSATRREAASRLGSLRARDAVPRLIRTLLDRDASVREAAAFALGQLTDRRAIEPLRSALPDKDAEVRASVVFALGMIGDRETVLAVSNALGDSSSAVRSAAMVALGLMQDEEGVDEIIDMLDDPSFDVRYDGIWALGQLGDPDAIEHLSAALVTLDMARIDDSQREALRIGIQNSIENLQPPARGATVAGATARPRRVVDAPPEATRPRRTLPYGIVDVNRVTAPKAEPQEKRQEPQARKPDASSGLRGQVLAATNRPIAIVRSVDAVATDRARRAGVKGTVGIRVLAGADGRAVRAYVTRRLGYGLDQRAVQAALEYRFDPALLAGLPQTSWVDIEMVFGPRD